ETATCEIWRSTRQCQRTATSAFLLIPQLASMQTDSHTEGMHFQHDSTTSDSRKGRGMISQRITNVTVQDFQQRAEGKKVILLYPWTNYRTLFLTHFLQDVNRGLLYYRIVGEDPTLEEWLSSMVAELDQVLDGWGQNLKEALDSGSAAKMGEALAADLATYAQ